ncbi:MAG: M13 family metallopeptidase [Proteobacteria bacterium]|nr:M13 family metallopeptidase [Pseudomonadota bacterium]
MGAWGFDESALDRSVRPGDDFFRFANGAWIKRTPVPPDRSRWGVFDGMIAKAESDLKLIIDELEAAPPAAGSDARRVADYWQAYADSAGIEARGLAPVATELDDIGQLHSHFEVGRFIAKPDHLSAGPIAFFPAVDTKEPNRYAIKVTQSGLGLPDRDFYLDPSQSFASIRAKYQAYITALLALAHYPHASQRAAEVLALEIAIARISWPYDQQRDYDATYHPKSRAQLIAMADGYPIDAMLGVAGVPAGYDRYIVAEDTAVPKLARLFRRTPVATWRAYLTFHCLDTYADVLPQAFDDAAFEFRGHVLNGQPEKRARWKRAISAVNGAIGDALGALYIERHFTPEAKAKMTELTDNLIAAYQVRISGLPWMTPATRAAALRKLASFRIMIGYPDHLKTYTGLDIRPDDPVGNERRAVTRDWQRRIDRLDQPVDRSEWGLLPQEVNAENLSTFNAVVFPAAILQPPFFDPAADAAVNYGAIGGVIGHEISHSFDDQGAKLDDTGRLHPWWTAEDVSRFKALSQELVTQYNAFEPLPGVHIKGANTIGENIADLGGLNAAFEAYTISLRGQAAPVLDGFSGEQRVFLGWAQAWREVIREAALRNRIVSDEHSPAEFRVNGVVRNIDAWYKAFSVPDDAMLYLPAARRAHIW